MINHFIGVDASQSCVGACLFQVTEDVEHPICFLSRKLRVHELHYSTIEKEALALVTAVRACSVYFGSSPVVVYTDHSPLQFINTMANSNQKLLRWSIELQQYTLDIKHRPGKENLMPDLLSRPSPGESSSVLLGFEVGGFVLLVSILFCFVVFSFCRKPMGFLSWWLGGMLGEPSQPSTCLLYFILYLKTVRIRLNIYRTEMNSILKGGLDFMLSTVYS